MTDPVSAAATAAATAVSKKVFDGLAKKLSDRILGATAAAADRVAVAFRVGFSEYLETSYKRCAVFKTIIAPSEPLDVLTHYVHVSLTCGPKKLTDDELLRTLPKLGCVVVTGLAGSGKSMFMRYLTLSSFNQDLDNIPLFIELRRLNSFKDKNLLAFVRNECTSKISVISENQFNLGLKAGIFFLILDGFDELNNDLKQDVGQQILNIRKDFKATNIVLSSRPDDRFASWAAFHVFRVDELAKEQTVALISSLPYDHGVKKRFVSA